jgi:hypothetical protein
LGLVCAPAIEAQRQPIAATISAALVLVFMKSSVVGCWLKDRF